MPAGNAPGPAVRPSASAAVLALALALLLLACNRGGGTTGTHTEGKSEKAGVGAPDLHPEAEAVIEEAGKSIELDPRDASAFKRRAGAYIETGRHREALDDLKTLTALDPGNINALLLEGIAYAEIGDLVNSLATFEKAVALDPKNAKAYINRGRARSLSGRSQEACLDWSTACDLGECKSWEFSLRNGECSP